jgi:hypothetical protein
MASRLYFHKSCGDSMDEILSKDSQKNWALYGYKARNTNTRVKNFNASSKVPWTHRKDAMGCKS